MKRPSFEGLFNSKGRIYSMKSNRKIRKKRYRKKFDTALENRINNLKKISKEKKNGYNTNSLPKS